MQRLFDSFTLEGPNGVHSCTVIEAGSCSVRTSQHMHRGRLRTPIARVIISELVAGVHLLHQRGIVHGGRFKTSLCR